MSTDRLKIAFLGTRGVPARYSGFETFYEQLGKRLADRKHEVTIYNRSHFIKDVKGRYAGMRLVSLPSIPTKHLDTISHTFLSSFHALFGRYDIVYYCIVGNSPLVWIPRVAGSKVILNVDGEDWAREKWGKAASWYLRSCERIAGRTANVVVADAQTIRERYSKEYQFPTVFVPYGANIRRDEGIESLAKWSLEPRRYILYVGRLVPENAALQLVRAFRNLDTDMKLVIAGDAPFAEKYKKKLRDSADARVVFTGYAFGTDYAQLSSHAYLYVQPSGVEGTRPAVLDQLGFGNCVLVRDTSANLEVVADCGLSFDRSNVTNSLAARLSELIANPATVESMRRRATDRIVKFYNWEWITDCYEEIFTNVVQGRIIRQYDDFVLAHHQAGGE